MNKQSKKTKGYRVRMEDEVLAQFEIAAQTMGMTRADFMRLALNTVIPDWYAHAARVAKGYGREIVKKAMGGKLNMTDQAQVDARVKELDEYDFTQKIQNRLNKGRRDQPPIIIEGCITDHMDEAEVYNVSHQYFYRMEKGEKADEATLAAERALLIRWLASETFHAIKRDLKLYLELKALRSQARKKAAAYRALQGDQINEPWTLRRVANNYHEDYWNYCAPMKCYATTTWERSLADHPQPSST
jgi:hypothetical protein